MVENVTEEEEGVNIQRIPGREEYRETMRGRFREFLASPRIKPPTKENIIYAPGVFPLEED